jgi:hypothetical protein
VEIIQSGMISLFFQVIQFAFSYFPQGKCIRASAIAAQNPRLEFHFFDKPLPAGARFQHGSQSHRIWVNPWTLVFNLVKSPTFVDYQISTM